MRDGKYGNYAVEDFFKHAACQSENMKFGVSSPLIHYTAESPCTKGGFPATIKKFFIKKNDPNTWNKIINSKNSMDQTYLDYIEYLTRQDYYSDDEIKSCRNQIIAFACKEGAVYSYYKDKKCPTSIY